MRVMRWVLVAAVAAAIAAWGLVPAGASERVNSFSGSCNFTFLVQDAAKKFIAKVTATFTENINSSSLTSTAFTIPKSSTVAGEGRVMTVVQCGTTKATSSSPVYIAFP